MNSNTLAQHNLEGTSFGYSAAGLEDLGATEYTLVTIVVDTSGSVASFKKDMEKAIVEVVNSCKYSKRSDNLMIRFVTFHSSLAEEHGFKLLSDCEPSNYDDCLMVGGTTALFDASQNSIEATRDYGKKLVDNDFDVNGIIFIITDGMDNASVVTKNGVKDSLAEALKSESLESLMTILIGVGTAAYPEVQSYLDEFKKDAGLTQYVNIKDADEKSLAKLAQFISKSISSQSNALNSGGASQPLTF